MAAAAAAAAALPLAAATAPPAVATACLELELRLLPGKRWERQVRTSRMQEEHWRALYSNQARRLQQGVEGTKALAHANIYIYIYVMTQ